MGYYWSLLSFAIGVLLGFQGIVERHPTDYLKAAFLTGPGLFYLLTRGTVPAGTFCLSYSFWPTARPVYLAFAAGLFAEGLLRSQFYVKQGKGADAPDIFKGGLGLLRWYQDFTLGRIPVRIAESRIKLVRKLLPKNVRFPELCELIKTNALAWPQDNNSATPAVVVQTVENAINKVRSEFDSMSAEHGTTDRIDESCRLKLAYSLMDKLGRKEFQTLISLPPK